MGSSWRQTVGVWSLALLACIPAVRKPESDAAMTKRLGDVRFSLLAPHAFATAHGRGWLLMDGQSIPKAILCVKLSICTMPDARGAFVRGMSLGRPSESGDPDDYREVGSYQPDHLLRHGHELAHFPNGAGLDNHGSPAPPRLHFDDGAPERDSTLTLLTTAVGASETRPRNVALYVYLRTN